MAGCRTGVRVVGPDLALIKEDPEFVDAVPPQRITHVHVWTVNEPDDIRFCRDLGVSRVSPPTSRSAWPRFSRE